MPRQEHRKIEPLFGALHDDGTSRRAAARSGLVWKLVIAALVFAGLLAIVLHQAF
jgi:hypothetical protein